MGFLPQGLQRGPANHSTGGMAEPLAKGWGKAGSVAPRAGESLSFPAALSQAESPAPTACLASSHPPKVSDLRRRARGRLL